MAGTRNIHKLIGFFSEFTVLPIDPDEVRDTIVSYGIKDEIEFVGVDVDDRVLYGAYRQYVKSDGLYADPVVHVDVYYNRSLGRDWKRLVCCKELLHMLDHTVSKTATKNDCENLVTHLAGLNLDGDPPFSNEKLQAWNDELMLYYAVAVLFPWEAREILYQDYCEDNARITEIVKVCDLPVSVVRLVLSDRWPRLYHLLAGSN